MRIDNLSWNENGKFELGGEWTTWIGIRMDNLDWDENGQLGLG